jgi:hypothetical protein
MAEPTTKQRFGEIAERGRAIYQKIKDKYEPHYIGKFLAIDPKTEKAYMADTFDEAYNIAHADNPEAFFYLLKIGYPSVGTMASIFST